MSTDHLTKSADVQGKPVLGHDGARLGSVREMFVDLARGTIEFVVVEAAGLLGGSGKFHPVPWSAVRFIAGIDAFQIDMDKDDFKASPSYDREQLANASYGWDEPSARYFMSSGAGPTGPRVTAIP